MMMSQRMKYVIVIPDGCADEPQPSLDGRTPLQAAQIPHMDRVAQRGIVGAASHVPPHLPAGSDVANLSLLGYDPNTFFTGRAPLEAAAQGIELGPHDWAIRCNLVTVEHQVMRSFTADHISSDEAAGLLHMLQQLLTIPGELADSGATIEFRPGVSYRNLLIYRGVANRPAPFTWDTRCTPPHDLTDRSVIDDYPRGPGCELLHHWMEASAPLLASHPINQKRMAQGHLPATHIWLWGCGKAPALPSFSDRFQKTGAMITAVDLLRGLARLMGWNVIEVPGATGYTDTDYGAKGRYAVSHLSESDLMCVHVEATDEASHEGDVQGKIRALEAIDHHIVGPILDALKDVPHRILISPDHPTPVRTKTHSHGLVPFAMAGEGITADEATTYDEVVADRSATQFPNGWELMPFFLGTSSSS